MRFLGCRGCVVGRNFNANATTAPPDATEHHAQHFHVCCCAWRETRGSNCPPCVERRDFLHAGTKRARSLGGMSRRRNGKVVVAGLVRTYSAGASTHRGRGVAVARGNARDRLPRRRTCERDSRAERRRTRGEERRGGAPRRRPIGRRRACLNACGSRRCRGRSWA